MKHVSAWIFFCGLWLSGPAQALENRANFDVSLGYREDRLSWNIANDLSGASTPNILSELKWTSLRSAQLKLGADYTHSSGMHVQGSAAYGRIDKGDNQDSDYLGDNRTLEFSRSDNKTDGDNVRDASVAVGYRIAAFKDRVRSNTYTTLLLGYSRHEQHLRITDGNQTVPATGPFTGLNSTYETRWKGPWVGLHLLSEERNGFASFLNLEHHKADYSADADWNLRADFQHPVSYTHSADGAGDGIAIGFIAGRRDDKPENWVMTFTWEYQRWTTDPGLDRTFFSDGTTADTRLNDVTWTSSSVSLGLQRRF